MYNAYILELEILHIRFKKFLVIFNSSSVFMIGSASTYCHTFWVPITCTLINVLVGVYDIYCMLTSLYPCRILVSMSSVSIVPGVIQYAICKESS